MKTWSKKFHLPVSFPVTFTLQANPSSISKKHFSNPPRAFSQLPRLSAESLRFGVGPRVTPGGSCGGHPAWRETGGRAHPKRLCSARDRGLGTRPEYSAQENWGRPDPEPRVRALVHRQPSGSASRLGSGSSAQARPRHSQAPRGKNSEHPGPRKLESRKVPGGGHPPDRAPPRAGLSKPTNSSHRTRRVSEGEPTPDPISARARRFSSALGRPCLRPLHDSPAPPGPQGWQRCARARHWRNSAPVRRGARSPDWRTERSVPGEWERAFSPVPSDPLRSRPRPSPFAPPSCFKARLLRGGPREPIGRSTRHGKEGGAWAPEAELTHRNETQARLLRSLSLLAVWVGRDVKIWAPIGCLASRREAPRKGLDQAGLGSAVAGLGPGVWGRISASGPGKMVLGGYPVSYLLLCGQAALLLGNLLLLHCVSRSHSHNATAEPELTSAGAAHPEGSPGAASWEYGDPHSPVILCSYL